VCLIRHAQSEDNARGLSRRMSRAAFNALLCSAADAALTPVGMGQARHLASRLGAIPLERVYTSPHVRALSTAAILGEAFGLTPQVMPDLREVMPPGLKETPAEAPLRWLFVRAYLSMLRPAAVAPSGSPSESWMSGYQRARRVWRAMTHDPSPGIAVVSHFAFIQLLLLEVRSQRRWRIVSRDLRNGGITMIVSRSDR
jgi:broad specificity phosphatase PhoE